MTEELNLQPDVPRFGIGTALAAAFQAIGRGLVPFLVVLVGIGAALFGVMFWAVERLANQPAAGQSWIEWVPVASSTIGDALLNAFVTGLALSAIEDGRADWRRAIARVPMVILPMALVSAVYAMIARFGIPGLPLPAAVPLTLAIGVFTWLYCSTLVREGGGPLSAMRRNLELSQGHRWRILALLVMVAVSYAVLAFGGGAVLGVFYAMWQVPIPALGPYAVDLAVMLLLNAFVYVTAAASYHMLRYEKDGPKQAELAGVFD
jgi:hypothetical protein